MLPLDAITNNNQVNNPAQLAAQLSQLKSTANIDGYALVDNIFL
jgi:hypothetical protein